MFVVFAAPLLSDNAMRMVEAAATLYGVRLGVITHDSADALKHLHGSVAHWRVSSADRAADGVWVVALDARGRCESLREWSSAAPRGELEER